MASVTSLATALITIRRVTEVAAWRENMSGFITIVALLVMTAGPGMAEETGNSPAGNIYPHDDKGNCDICHLAPESDLRSWFTFGSTKRKLHGDYNALCLKCHNIALGHGVGKRPKTNRERLPLDGDGKIACAITCHNMHIKSDDQKQAKFHLRTPVNSLCRSCHDN